MLKILKFLLKKKIKFQEIGHQKTINNILIYLMKLIIDYLVD